MLINLAASLIRNNLSPLQKIHVLLLFTPHTFTQNLFTGHHFFHLVLEERLQRRNIDHEESKKLIIK